MSVACPVSPSARRVPDAPVRRGSRLWATAADSREARAWEDARAQTPDWEWTVLGRALGTWTSDPYAAICDADVVVTHAGQGAIADVAAGRRPAVVIPADRPYGEQRATAEVLAAGGWPVQVEQTFPRSGWRDRLEQVARLDGSAWSGWTDGHAAARVADLLLAELAALAPGRRSRGASGPTTAVVTLAHGRRPSAPPAPLALRRRCPARPLRGRRDGRPRPALVAPGGEVPQVVVPLDAEPDALPLAAARNAGAATALEAGMDVLVFLDVDCLAGDALVASYTRAAVARPDVLWSGPVTYLPPAPPTGYDLRDLDYLDDPHPARPAPQPGTSTVGGDPDLFWSLSFAVHRDGWLRTGGFCEEYVGYGGEDTDFARVARREGLELGWLGSARAYHQHHPSRSHRCGTWRRSCATGACSGTAGATGR